MTPAQHDELIRAEAALYVGLPSMVEAGLRDPLRTELEAALSERVKRLRKEYGGTA